MIVEAIIGVLIRLIDLAPLPSWSSLDINGAVDVVLLKVAPYLGLVGWIDNYFPLHEAFTLAALLLGLWVAAHIYQGVIWFLSKMHILGAS